MPRRTSVRKIRALTLVLAAFITVTITSPAQAISFGKPGGDWPKSWPKELEPYRKTAWTWEHGFGGISYHIHFEKAEEFEAAWPHIVSLKSKGAPLTLVKGPYVRVRLKEDTKGRPAGVIIRPPFDKNADGALATTRIVLVVDGDIIDLNRFRLPPDTPIVDERFKD